MYPVNDWFNRAVSLAQHRLYCFVNLKVPLEEILNDAFDTAIKKAALEAFEGQYQEDELIFKIQPEEIKARALSLINA